MPSRTDILRRSAYFESPKRDGFISLSVLSWGMDAVPTREGNARRAKDHRRDGTDLPAAPSLGDLGQGRLVGVAERVLEHAHRTVRFQHDRMHLFHVGHTVRAQDGSHLVVGDAL